MDEDNFVPIYYSVSGNLSDAQISYIHHALSITPIIAAIIVDAHAGELASKFSPVVLTSPTIKDAHDLARQLSKEGPVVILGDTAFYAHYSDGRSEEITAPV